MEGSEDTDSIPSEHNNIQLSQNLNNCNDRIGGVSNYNWEAHASNRQHYQETMGANVSMGNLTLGNDLDTEGNAKPRKQDADYSLLYHKMQDGMENLLPSTQRQAIKDNYLSRAKVDKPRPSIEYDKEFNYEPVQTQSTPLRKRRDASKRQQPIVSTINLFASKPKEGKLSGRRKTMEGLPNTGPTRGVMKRQPGKQINKIVLLSDDGEHLDVEEDPETVPKGVNIQQIAASVGLVPKPEELAANSTSVRSNPIAIAKAASSRNQDDHRHVIMNLLPDDIQNDDTIDEMRALQGCTAQESNEVSQDGQLNSQRQAKPAQSKPKQRGPLASQQKPKFPAAGSQMKKPYQVPARALIDLHKVRKSQAQPKETKQLALSSTKQVPKTSAKKKMESPRIMTSPSLSEAKMQGVKVEIRAVHVKKLMAHTNSQACPSPEPSLRNAQIVHQKRHYSPSARGSSLKQSKGDQGKTPRVVDVDPEGKLKQAKAPSNLKSKTVCKREIDLQVSKKSVRESKVKSEQIEKSAKKDTKLPVKAPSEIKRPPSLGKDPSPKPLRKTESPLKGSGCKKGGATKSPNSDIDSVLKQQFRQSLEISDQTKLRKPETKKEKAAKPPPESVAKKEFRFIQKKKKPETPQTQVIRGSPSTIQRDSEYLKTIISAREDEEPEISMPSMKKDQQLELLSPNLSNQAKQISSNSSPLRPRPTKPADAATRVGSKKTPIRTFAPKHQVPPPTKPKQEAPPTRIEISKAVKAKVEVTQRSFNLGIDSGGPKNSHTTRRGLTQERDLADSRRQQQSLERLIGKNEASKLFDTIERIQSINFFDNSDAGSAKLDDPKPLGFSKTPRLPPTQPDKPLKQATSLVRLPIKQALQDEYQINSSPERSFGLLKNQTQVANQGGLTPVSLSSLQKKLGGRLKQLSMQPKLEETKRAVQRPEQVEQKNFKHNFKPKPSSIMNSFSQKVLPSTSFKRSSPMKKLVHRAVDRAAESDVEVEHVDHIPKGKTRSKQALSLIQNDKRKYYQRGREEKPLEPKVQCLQDSPERPLGSAFSQYTKGVKNDHRSLTHRESHRKSREKQLDTQESDVEQHFKKLFSKVSYPSEVVPKQNRTIQPEHNFQTKRNESQASKKREQFQRSGSKSLKQFILEQKRELKKARARQEGVDQDVVEEVSPERMIKLQKVMLDQKQAKPQVVLSEPAESVKSQRPSLPVVDKSASEDSQVFEVMAVSQSEPDSLKQSVVTSTDSKNRASILHLKTLQKQLTIVKQFKKDGYLSEEDEKIIDSLAGQSLRLSKAPPMSKRDEAQEQYNQKLLEIEMKIDSIINSNLRKIRHSESVESSFEGARPSFLTKAASKITQEQMSTVQEETDPYFSMAQQHKDGAPPKEYFSGSSSKRARKKWKHSTESSNIRPDSAAVEESEQSVPSVKKKLDPQTTEQKLLEFLSLLKNDEAMKPKIEKLLPLDLSSKAKQIEVLEALKQEILTEKDEADTPKIMQSPPFSKAKSVKEFSSVPNGEGRKFNPVLPQRQPPQLEVFNSTQPLLHPHTPTPGGGQFFNPQQAFATTMGGVPAQPIYQPNMGFPPQSTSNYTGPVSGSVNLQGDPRMVMHNMEYQSMIEQLMREQQSVEGQLIQQKEQTVIDPVTQRQSQQQVKITTIIQYNRN